MALSFHAESAKRLSLASGASSDPPVAIRPSSPRKRRYSRAARPGLLIICPTSKRAESRISSSRTPTSGLAASVFCAACSRRSLSKPTAAGTSFAMAILTQSTAYSRTLGFTDQHAQYLSNKGRLVLTLDFQRTLQFEQHAATALRFGGDEVGLQANARS